MQAKQLVTLFSLPHPRRMFAPNDLGCILNPSNLPAVFQTTTSSIAGAVGSAVGRLLDERYFLARYGSVVVNGEFSADSDWTKGAGWSIAGGKAVRVADAGGSLISQAYGSIGAKAWEYSIVVEAVAGTLTVRLTGGTSVIGPDITTTGTHTGILTGNGANTAFAIAMGTTVTGTATIDSITIREIPGSHALQGSAGSRPALAAGGKVDYDGVDDSLVITFPSDMGANCTVARAVPNGEATILTGQTIATTYTDSTDHCGLVIINRALTATETNQLRRWLNRRAG